MSQSFVSETNPSGGYPCKDPWAQSSRFQAPIQACMEYTMNQQQREQPWESDGNKG